MESPTTETKKEEEVEYYVPRLEYFVINGSLLLIFFSWRIFIATGALSNLIFWYATLSAYGFFQLFLKPSDGQTTTETAEGKWTTYDGSTSTKPEQYYHPTTIEEIASIIKYASENKRRVKVFGHGHAMNSISLTAGNAILLDKFNQIVKIEDNQVTVQAGITLKQLQYTLWEKKYSLSVAPPNSSQTVGGAIQTACHGSSAKQGSFPSLVTELTVVTASGEILVANSKQNQDLFNSVRVGLGAIGVVAIVSLKIEPAFYLQYVDQAIDKSSLESELSKASEADYFSLRWIPGTNVARKTVMTKTTTPPSFLNSVLTWLKMEPFRMLSGLALTFTGAYPSVHDYVISNVGKLSLHVEGILPSFSAFSASELPVHSAIEYSVSSDKAKTVLTELQNLIQDKKWKLNCFASINWVKADSEIYLSNFEADSVTFSITIIEKSFMRRELIGVLDEFFKKFNGKPHWAKQHNLKYSDFTLLYPKGLPSFEEARKKYDPQGIFLNNYLNRCLISSN